jgi:membrane-bound serine protease (ClpP class)
MTRRAMIFFLPMIISAVMLVGGVAQPTERHVYIMDVEGAINPATATFLERGLDEARKQEAELVVVRLDTPGGLASSMKSMVKAIMNSPVPVVVYVAPSGAGAASAGVMVTVAAHVAAMAPGTNIGAAHPVAAGGREIDKTMSEKVVHDMASYGRSIAQETGRNADWVERAIRESVSITAEEAVERNVVDLIAVDIDELLKQIDGREITLKSAKVVLKTRNLEKKYVEQGIRYRILKTISDPNIAYILMMIGLAGLYFELSHPGAIFPGVIGAISLILAFYSFQTLPVNYAGLLLIALAVILFVAEIMVSSYGVLSLGGLISLTLGSVMLFEDVGVSLKLMAPTIVLIGAFFVVLSTLAFRAYRTKPKTGMEGLIGSTGVVKQPLDPEGLVFVHGEYWRAVSEEKLELGDKVRVESADGLLLKVKKLSSEQLT